MDARKVCVYRRTLIRVSGTYEFDPALKNYLKLSRLSDLHPTEKGVLKPFRSLALLKYFLSNMIAETTENEDKPALVS